MNIKNQKNFLKNKKFCSSDLYQTFKDAPLGFVDVGSLGWIHPMTLKAAPLIHALCFELDKKECDRLRAQYDADGSYAKVSVIQMALDKKASRNTKLYISKHPSNTSLLVPSPDFVQRYTAPRFEVDRVIEIPTQPLDEIIFNQKTMPDQHMGEFIKVDTQGTEYRIFEGAKKVLAERCLAVFCEVEFFEVYKNQKTYADIDMFLREYGLCLYGFYPHYRSTRKLDVKRYAGEERLMWADALFIKDPFDARNKGKKFSERDLKALILIGVMCRFYDLALEIAGHVYGEGPQLKLIEDLIKAEALVDQQGLLEEVAGLHEKCKKNPQETYLHTSHFVSRKRSNNSNDFLFEKTLEEG